MQLQKHVDGVSFPQFFQKVENGIYVGKQVASEWQASGKLVASKCKIMSTVGQFLSLSKRLRTECMLACKWAELQLLNQLLNPKPVILLSVKR